MTRSSFARLAALLVPPVCAACRSGCAPQQEICEVCRLEIEQSARPPVRAGHSAAFIHAGRARELTLALKFGGAVALADQLAELMLGRIGAEFAGAGAIVPVPAHPARLRARGYNQSALLARALAVRTGASVLDCLVRSGDRRPQSELGRLARLALPAGAIRVDPRSETSVRAVLLASPEQTNVVVCDDVATTGSTLEACTQAMREQLPRTGWSRLRAVSFAAA